VSELGAAQLLIETMEELKMTCPNSDFEVSAPKTSVPVVA
jgi:hypothetical protein